MEKKFFRWLYLSMGLVLLLFGFRKWAIEDRWQRALALAEQVERELDSMPSTRPILHGEAIEGSAFEEYARLAALLQPSAHDDWIQSCKDLEFGETESRDALLAEHSEFWEVLSRGARSVDARYSVDWKLGARVQTPRLMDDRTIANLALFSVRQRIECGDYEAATNTFLDALQFGRDKMHTPVLIGETIGCALVAIVADEALIRGDRGGDPLLELFPQQELARLAIAFERLDSGIEPIGRGHRGEIPLGIRNIESTGVSGAFPGDWTWESWASGFSPRAMFADYAINTHEWIEQLEVEYERGPAALDRFIAVTERADWMMLNPITEYSKPSRAGSFRTRRQVLLRFRFARMAIEYRLHGSVTPLSDPFGTEIRVIEDGDEIRFESAEATRNARPARYRLTLDRHDF